MAEQTQTIKKAKICIGDKVLLENNDKGQVLFIGNVAGKNNIYYGIALSDASGKHDGCISGVQYFECTDKHGVFKTKAKIKKSKASDKDKYKSLPRLEIGDKVTIPNIKTHGTVRFIGTAEIRPNEISYGIELDQPKGSHNGIVSGREYFQCQPKCGVIVGANELIPKLVIRRKKKSSKKTKGSPKKKSSKKSMNSSSPKMKNISKSAPHPLRRKKRMKKSSKKINVNRYPSMSFDTNEYQNEQRRKNELLLVHGYCHLVQMNHLTDFFATYYHDDKESDFYVIPTAIIEVCYAFLYQKMKIDDFDQLQLLGKGGFAEVRLVKYKHAQNELEYYAMKSLSKERMIKKKQQHQIFMERDVLIHLNHWLIVKLYWTFQDRKYLHIVQEYAAGGDLMRVLMENEILSETDTQFYIAEIAQVINFLHQNKYVHRDIKPDNILLDKTGHIKLCDFGSSAFYDPDEYDKDVTPRRSRKNKLLLFRIVGTPDYVAPEVLRKKGYGFECDWWGLGVILFECLCGYPPFYSGSAKQTCRNILNFSRTLKIPSDCDISPNAKDCISKLLCSYQARMNFFRLHKHPFFKGIRWDSLSLMRPPHPMKSDADNLENLGIAYGINENDDSKLYYTQTANSMGVMTPNAPPPPGLMRKQSSHQRTHFKGFTFEASDDVIFE